MNLHFEKTGQGIPLVLSCGIGDASDVWSDYIEPLSQHFTVIRWDHRGHGRSDKTEDPSLYTRELALADLTAMIEAAGGSADNPAILMGHSLGGYLSLCKAVQKPELVKGLILVASGPGFKDQSAREKWNTTALSIDLGAEVAHEARRLGVQPDSVVMEQIDTISVPALVLVGSEDKRFVGAKDYLVKKLSKGTGVVIPEARHSVHKSHSNEVLAAVEQFLGENFLGD